MHKKFDSQALEAKWRQRWEQSGIYNVGDRDPSKEKEYVLVEWPYPSGNLHIGHWYAFAVPDIYVRYRRMTGKQVIYPMGFDAFGLPAENAAIKRDTSPRAWTESNIAYMKGQLASMGNAFSWDKTASSTDPEYYKWTQWMFTEFFKHDIAYRGVGIVNWCPGCQTVIANEQVLADGTCERSGDIVEKREMPQWMIRITDFADALVDDLDDLNWPEHIKEAQRQWIGRSEGAEIDFSLSVGNHVTVFTTRPDTLFGVTYLVLAPEHPFLEKYKTEISNWDEVATYIQKAKQRDEQDRLDATKEKTGVRLEGMTATNPANGETVPVFVADYVLGNYGTGAIMAVPAHDERDHAFAQKFGLPIKSVIAKHVINEFTPPQKAKELILNRDAVDMIIEDPTGTLFLIQEENDKQKHVHFVGGGTDGEPDLEAARREVIEETGFQNFEVAQNIVAYICTDMYRHTKDKNLHSRSAFVHIKLKDLTQTTSEIEEGKHTVKWVPKEEVSRLINWTNHLAGWEMFLNPGLFTGSGTLHNSGEFDGMDSEEAKVAITEKVGGRMTNTYRLRDWSIGRQRYWGVPIPIVYDPEGKAHVVPKEHLPWTLPEDVDFRPTGVPPLAKSAELKRRTEEIFGAGWTPEVETMDTFVDSSWYFLRYIDNHNDHAPASLEAQKAWMPVDIYFGGAEHTTMHVLYSRFWQKALHKLGLAVHNEPYTRRINRSLILGPDGNKMSKSKGNVIDPDEQVARVGADTVKMYLAFMGPYGEMSNYPWDMGGIAGLRRFLERVNGLTEHIVATEPEEVTRQLHKTIKKVTTDIQNYKFNTAISSLMILVNLIEKQGLSQTSYLTLLKLLAPFAPFLTEELWQEAGQPESVHKETYPTADESLTLDSNIEIGVQINGKLRGSIVVTAETTADEAVTLAKAETNLQTKLMTGEIKKVIYVPGKILNLIVV